jgi:hypothetical protein
VTNLNGEKVYRLVEAAMSLAVYVEKKNKQTKGSGSKGPVKPAKGSFADVSRSR